ncbi:MAG TPA: ATP-binding protein [Kofleriaceae bacterium]|nr:ATP-binding protein [Kofleriaceae bacterium]
MSDPELALQVLVDGIAVLDTAGIVTYANPAAIAFGVTLGASYAVPLDDTVVNGRVISTATTSVPAGGVVVVLRDLTDRVIASRRTELAERRVEHAVHAASLAHQINNPLAIINVHAELIKDELASLRARHREDAKRYADIDDSMTELEAAVASITALTADLRAYSQPMPGANRGDLRRAVEWACRTAAPALRDRARAVIQIGANGKLALEEPKLGRLLVALLHNAAAAIPVGRAEFNDVVISSRESATPGRLVIEINDTGVGMTEPATFTPKVTGHPIRVGLGLAECRAIVDEAKGAMVIDSQPGVGTTVTVELPLR